MDSKSADDGEMVVSMFGIDTAKGSNVAPSAMTPSTFQQMKSALAIMSEGIDSTSVGDDEGMVVSMLGIDAAEGSAVAPSAAMSRHLASEGRHAFGLPPVAIAP